MEVGRDDDLNHPLLEVIFKLPESDLIFHPSFSNLLVPQRWLREVESMLAYVRRYESFDFGIFHDSIFFLTYEADREFSRCSRVRIEVNIDQDDGPPRTHVDGGEMVVLMQRLSDPSEATADPSHRRGFGAVPASMTSIESLKTLTVGVTDGVPAGGECSVCLETMGRGEEVCRMPCSHVFHACCLRQWLRLSRLCPLCRFSLTADDGD
ncbi:hypothetical protein OPV22_006793 [Ensete ventricosum]|uniref:RING-type domain-containing protein n=1 Tax=Ensete ventricosum TaxID=4639 RepID=A0AAV8RM42_ENSVE|nr:hypothetical protein OPV22_006793 [Ensete ventricosum]